jgi:hypothetical protein
LREREGNETYSKKSVGNIHRSDVANGIMHGAAGALPDLPRCPAPAPACPARARERCRRPPYIISAAAITIRPIRSPDPSSGERMVSPPFTRFPLNAHGISGLRILYPTPNICLFRQSTDGASPSWSHPLLHSHLCAGIKGTVKIFDATRAALFSGWRAGQRITAGPLNVRLELWRHCTALHCIALY